MNIFSDPIAKRAGKNLTPWDITANYEKEDRPVCPVDKVVIKGGVDLVFGRFDSPRLVVAGEDPDAVKRIITSTAEDKLVIEQKPHTTVVVGSTTQHFYGPIGVIGEHLHLEDNFQCIQVGNDGITINGHKIAHSTCDNQKRAGYAMVGFTLPLAPNFTIKGRSNVTLIDVRQEQISLKISGSGSFVVTGEVAFLKIKIEGSGDVNCKQLKADRASITIEGSGDVEACVVNEVRARISGSGDVVISGTPSARDVRVDGTGEVSFR